LQTPLGSKTIKNEDDAEDPEDHPRHDHYLVQRKDLAVSPDAWAGKAFQRTEQQYRERDAGDARYDLG